MTSPTPRIYGHYRGDFYEVLGHAKDEKTWDDDVIYVNIANPTTWIHRRAYEFYGFVIPETQASCGPDEKGAVRRFRPIGKDEVRSVYPPLRTPPGME